MTVRRLHPYCLALSPLLALTLAACGAPSQPPVAAVAEQGTAVPPSNAEAAAGGATLPAESQSQLQIGVVRDPGEGGDTAGSSADPISDPAGAPLDTTEQATAGMGDGSGLLAFASRRESGGGGGFDIFVFDRAAGTVFAVPGVNTEDDEVHPRMSPNGDWMVYASNMSGDFDIQLYDVGTRTIRTLRTLNTGNDDLSPSIDNAGDTVAFTTENRSQRELRIHELTTGDTLIPAPVRRLNEDISDPDLSGDGNVVAFSADVGRGGSNVFLYDLAEARLLNPPFVNTSADEIDPVLSEGGEFLLFSSNRGGDDDLFLADLRSGFVDRLTLANTRDDEVEPRFVAGSAEEIIFQSDRTGSDRIYSFNVASGLVDTLPITASLDGDDDILDDGNRQSIGGGSSSGGFGGFFGRGNFGGIGGIFR